MDVIENGPTDAGTGGGWRRWRPSRRSRIAALAMAGSVLFGYVMTHRLAGAGGQPASQPPAATSSPPRTEPQSEPLVGRSGHGPARLRVVLNNAEPLILDLDTGRAHPVGKVPSRRGDLVYVLPSRDALLAQVRGRGTGLLGNGYLLRPGRPARPLPDTAVLPGRNGTIVTTTNFTGPDARPTVSGQTVDGHPLWRWTAPGGFLPARDTPHGLLLLGSTPSARSGEPTALLVRRQTGQVLRRFGIEPVALGDEHVAHFRRDCQRRCPLVLTRLRDGRQRTFAEPHGHGGDHGQFSPDNRWLAMVRAGPEGSSRPATAAVLDLRTGAVLPVPGLRGPAQPPPSFAWSPDGRWLIVAVLRGEWAQIGVWRPDRPDEPVTVLPEAFPGGEYLWITPLP